MASVNEIAGAVSVEARRAALEAALHSGTFARNPRLTALLQYLCVRSFRGQTSSTKEYDIATDVFARPVDFDQSRDAIVRVEMHRLRKKLKEFYSGEGADQPVEIVIHSGNYSPEFIAREMAETRAAREEHLPPTGDVPKSPAKDHIQVSRRFVWVAAGALVLLLGAGGLAIVSRMSARESVARLADQPLGRFNSATAASDEIRILCGSSKGGYRDRRGSEWGADAYYSGGNATELPPQPIYRTRDAYLFRSMRSGEFSYKIPLKPGIYELRLYFADTSYSPGTAMEGGENVRVFNVLINDMPALRDFDIIADSAPNTADIRVFKDISPANDGYLHLRFSKLTDLPLINAIEVVPGIPHRLRPIRIITQDSALRDRNGVSWSPDNYFLSGRTMARLGEVSGTYATEIYERERYGKFSYAIPVAPGRYAVTLHFAETYWGPNEQGGGGIGSRIFDVYCNGTALLRGFDMFKESGSHRQLIKVFHDLEPDAQGKLLLSFVPKRNYANVSAIEVIDEAE